MPREKFFQVLTGKTIKCLACRHYCTIPLNGFGLCGVRKNVGGRISLIVDSYPCSMHLDPIEKKPLFHYLPGSKTMSLGFFGCNFRCDFCQNYDISFVRGASAEKEITTLKEFTPQDLIDTAIENDAKSIAITYNEPAISVEYNLEAFALAKKQSPQLGTVYVSNGYVSEEQLEALSQESTRLDAINIDLKSFNEDFYKKICGGELEEVLKSIRAFHKKGVWVELTTLLIPGKNDSNKELNQIASWISDLDKNIPWHVSAFFPTHKMISVPPTSTIDVIRAVEIGKKNGLNFVYGGNVRAGLENTFCPKCGHLVIKRFGYDAEIIGMEKNKCSNCGEKIAGVFE
jgi:pyruvate formate lyase activating enzyme